MKKVVLSSLRWLLAGRFLAQIGTWIITIIVIRLLSPGDYGLMALASIFIGFFGLFEELGLSAAIINKESLSDSNIKNIFGLLVVFSLVVYLVIYFGAGIVANFFGEPELYSIIQALALKLPIASLASIPSSLIQREMLFRKKSIVEFTSAIISSSVTLLLALTGHGVWSLVYGALCLATVRMIGLWIALGKVYIPAFHFEHLRSDLQFGGFVSLDRILWYLSSQADVFFIGKFLGKEVLGVYSVAMQLATLPMQKVSQILNEVGFAAFSRIQSDRQDVKEKLLLAVRMVSFISFPVFFGIAAVSSDLVPALLGSDWLAVVLPLMLLPLIVPLRMLDSITATVLFGIGRPGRAASNNFIALSILAPAFAIAAYYGDIRTVCMVWLIFYPAYFLTALLRTLPIFEISLPYYLYQVLRPLIFGTIMYFSVMAVSKLASLLVPNPAMSLAISIAFGALLYFSFLALFDRVTLTRFLTLIRG